jgi:hypothetical protein
VRIRSNHAFILPYYSPNERGEMVLYKTHLHHPQYSKDVRNDGSTLNQTKSRLRDIITILTNELQAIGFPDLRHFAERFHLPAINTAHVNVDEAYAEYAEQQFDKHKANEQAKRDAAEHDRIERAQRMIKTTLEKANLPISVEDLLGDIS